MEGEAPRRPNAGVPARLNTGSRTRPSISSAPPSLAGWFGLLLGFRLGICSAVAVKENAMGSQIADERVQVVGQLLIVQKRRHQAFDLCRGVKGLARVRGRMVVLVSGFVRGR